MKKLIKWPPVLVQACRKTHDGLVLVATALPIVLLVTWYAWGIHKLAVLFSPAWFHPGAIPSMAYSAILSLTGYHVAGWLVWVLCYVSPIILPLFAFRMLKLIYFPALGVFGILKHFWAVLRKKASGRSKAVTAVRSYCRLLVRYSGNGELFCILRTHAEFLPYFLFPPCLAWYRGTDLWHALKSSPFEFHDLLRDVDQAVRKIAGDDSGISRFEETDDGYSFNVREGKLSSSSLIAKLEKDRTEIFRKLPGFKSNDSVFSMAFATESDSVRATVTRTPVWTIQELDPASKEAEVPEGKLLLGFSKGADPEDMYADLSELSGRHITVSGGSRNGKDGFIIGSLLFSLINRKLRGEPVLIHLFDTKSGTDWEAFSGMEVHGILRHDFKGSDFALELEKIADSMKVRAEKIGIHSNYLAYNKAHPEDPIPETVVFVNEMVSLFQDDNADRIASALVRLSAEGLGMGISLVLASQSTRRDIHKAFGRILVNFDLHFCVKISNVQELRIIGAGLSKRDQQTLLRLPKYVVAMVDAGNISKVFRAYKTDQIAMTAYAKSRFGEGSETNAKPETLKREHDEQWATDRINAFMEDSKIAEYVEVSRKSGYLVYAEAAERGIPESSFRKLSKAFQVLGEIVREPGIGLRFAAGPQEEKDEDRLETIKL